MMDIWRGKCPRCREGDIFTYPLRQITRFGAMNSTCAHCGASFNPEPGFYFGALYVSYAFNVTFFIAVWLVLYLFFDPPTWVYIISLIACSILFLPISFRYSRILFLYWFGGLGKK
jgi:uncharacterized protein (DUF983 family)